MADGGGVKQFTDEIEQATNEVAKDVKDAVGQTIEQGVQSVAGTQLTPQQIQQKELDRQKGLLETRRKIKWYQDIEASQKAVSEKEKQELLQRQQLEEQEKQKKKMEEAQKKQVIPMVGKVTGGQLREDLARTQMERSKGRGVGG